MARLGADPDQLRELAATLRSSARRIDDVALGLLRRVRTTGWRGADAARFDRDWEQRHGPALRAASEQFSTLARSLDRQVLQQLETSAAGRGPLASTPEPAPPRPRAVRLPDLPRSEVRYQGGFDAKGLFVTGGIQGDLSIQRLGDERSRVVFAQQVRLGATAAVGASARLSIGAESYSSSPLAGGGAAVGARGGAIERRSWEVADDQVDDLLVRLAGEQLAQRTVGTPNPAELGGSALDWLAETAFGVDPGVDELARGWLGTPEVSGRELLGEVEVSASGGLGSSVGLGAHAVGSASVRVGRSWSGSNGSAVIELGGSGAAGLTAALMSKLGVPLDERAAAAASVRIQMPDRADAGPSNPTLVKLVVQQGSSLRETIIGIDLSDPAHAPTTIRVGQAFDSLSSGDLDAASASIQRLDVPDELVAVSHSSGTVSGHSIEGGADVSGGIGVSVSARGQQLDIARSPG